MRVLHSKALPASSCSHAGLAQEGIACVFLLTCGFCTGRHCLRLPAVQVGGGNSRNETCVITLAEIDRELSSASLTSNRQGTLYGCTFLCICVLQKGVRLEQESMQLGQQVRALREDYSHVKFVLVYKCILY